MEKKTKDRCPEVAVVSREELEKRLTAKYLNQIVSHVTISGRTTVGKVMRLAVWPESGHERVHVQIGNTLHKLDVEYFEQHTTVL
jgi:hypothetical protein